jgi:uroporphyrinogen-III synthase
MAKAPVVIVTRPQREADSWAAGLQAQGVATEVLPLIQIAPLADIEVLKQAWQNVPQHLAVMFVSANAVRFFMAERPVGLDIQTCRAWSTGPGTQAALLACGWPAEQIDSPDPSASQFDSEVLWALVADRVAQSVQVLGHVSVLIVRGADAQGHLAGRDWLVQKLEATGVLVQQVVAYVRQAPQLSSEQKLRVSHSMSDGSGWLFSSSEAAQHLLQACPDAPIGQAFALATHPRIAQRLQVLGWGRVVIVPAALEAQAVSIKSLL